MQSAGILILFRFVSHRISHPSVPLSFFLCFVFTFACVLINVHKLPGINSPLIRLAFAPSTHNYLPPTIGSSVNIVARYIRILWGVHCSKLAHSCCCCCSCRCHCLLWPTGTPLAVHLPAVSNRFSGAASKHAKMAASNAHSPSNRLN